MFIDLNIYLVPFTVTDTIELLSYFAFKCNGTVLLGEIHRRIMSDLELYFELYLNCRSMYVFLCEVNKIIAPDKAIGSCTECRYCSRAVARREESSGRDRDSRLGTDRNGCRGRKRLLMTDLVGISPGTPNS